MSAPGVNWKIVGARVLALAGVLATGGPLLEHLPARWHDPVQAASLAIVILLARTPPAHWPTSTPADKTAPPEG